MPAKFERSRSYYKILQVAQTATQKEIKTSYRKLALRLHPDHHRNDPKKTEEFRIVTEAYTVLSDVDKRNTYDFNNGFRYNKNRRTPPPKDYRTVKFPKKPRGWKTVWDHQLHYDMHYGDGMYREILMQARKELEQKGLTTYQSSLGPGFSFVHINEERKGDKGHSTTTKQKADPFVNINPYARGVPQGPRANAHQIIIDYEEITINSGRQHQQRRVHVVENLHTRRAQRREFQSQRQQQPKRNAAFDGDPDADMCLIL